ncbi:MAG: cell division protein FtsZ [Euryarchaeota archaeon RBG_19FT_COMBO_56_21]|nr:MAG: cell division protein FtsZ [Euryarchaeota archaeon RBG_19FT_COMBO_56_21]
MKSLIDDALEQHEIVKSKPPLGTPDDEELAKIVEKLKVNITIVGCGGGGSNTINRLSTAGVFGAELVAANSDAKHLLHVHAPHKVLLGRATTKGLGAGALPEIGEKAAQESEEELKTYVKGANIVFVTAGMGGGTGTGSAPLVARLARESGALVIGVVTLPFKAEGALRMENALRGLERLRMSCDTTAVISNDKLLEMVPRLPLDAAFRVADEVLMESIKGLTEIVTRPGLVNLDFNDVMTIMKNGGVAMIGMGEASNKTAKGDRIESAVQQALESPLLGDIDLSAAKGALIRVTGGDDMTVSEAEKAAEMVSAKVSQSARIIWGCSVDPEMKGLVRVMAVLTGVRGPSIMTQKDAPAKSKHGMEFVR